MLSNIYASARDWRSVASVRMQIKNTGTQKPSGASSIELDVDVHEFTVLNRSHPKSDGIYQMIDGLGLHLKQVGYVPKAYVKRLQFIDARKLELNLRPCTRYYRREHDTFPLYLLENFTLGFLTTLHFTFICVFGEICAEESISPMQEFSARCAVEYLRHMQNKVPKKYHYLKVVEVVGFAGSTVVEFIICVLENVVSLEKFILNPHFPWNGGLPSQYDDNFIPMHSKREHYEDGSKTSTRGQICGY
ncbi:hypothetical protein ACSBR2_010963 [Camellia fascicularis]